MSVKAVGQASALHRTDSGAAAPGGSQTVVVQQRASDAQWPVVGLSCSMSHVCGLTL